MCVFPSFSMSRADHQAESSARADRAVGAVQKQGGPNITIKKTVHCNPHIFTSSSSQSCGAVFKTETSAFFYSTDRVETNFDPDRSGNFFYMFQVLIEIFQTFLSGGKTETFRESSTGTRVQSRTCGSP